MSRFVHSGLVRRGATYRPFDLVMILPEGLTLGTLLPSVVPYRAYVPR